jgi:hypothetical protein
MYDDQETRADSRKLLRILLEAEGMILLHSEAHFMSQCAKLGIRYGDVLRELGIEEVENIDLYEIEQHLLRTYPGRYEPCPELFP